MSRSKRRRNVQDKNFIGNILNSINHICVANIFVLYIFGDSEHDKNDEYMRWYGFKLTVSRFWYGEKLFLRGRERKPLQKH